VPGGTVHGTGQERESAPSWRLVDDRSLSMDEGDDEGAVSGLGDGLVDALAAVSGSDVRQAEHEDDPPRKSASGRGGRDRRRRKHRADRPIPQAMGMGGASSSSSPPPPVEIRNALLEAYGNRRRVEERHGVLSQEALVAEILYLLNVRASLRSDRD
jgi:hypothetical protein